MLFNDPYFFLFLIVVIGLLLVGNRTYKKIIFLVSSYFFYGLWDWRFLLLLFFSTCVDFFVGKKLELAVDTKSRKRLLAISVVANLGTLAFFKYYNFFIESFVAFLTQVNIDTSFTTLNIILPVGISFYTFQTMSYTIDIYRKEIKPTKSLLDFAVFVSFFPQLVAGPIERAKNLLPQIENFNGISKKGIKTGLVLMLMGYLKKVTISDNIAPIVDDYFINYAELDSIYLLVGLVLFSIQIYFDFSGYSDIARGLAKMMGIDLMINFNQPYFSLNPSEFWNRWHISLSSWLKDYLYIPLGGNRRGDVRMYVNLMLTMILGGLWHGASWNFVFWGCLHGVYLLFYKMANITPARSIFINISQAILFYVLVLFTWLPFRSPDFNVTFEFLTKLFYWQGGIDISSLMLVFFIMALLLLIDLPAYIYKEHEYLLRLPSWLFIFIFTVVVISIVLTLALYQDEARPFIYFQF